MDTVEIRNGIMFNITRDCNICIWCLCVSCFHLQFEWVRLTHVLVSSSYQLTGCTYMYHIASIVSVDVHCNIALLWHVHVCVCRFIEKYHPTRVSALNEAVAANLQSRVRAFLFLLESGRLDKVPLSCDKQEEIVNVMDAGGLIRWDDVPIHLFILALNCWLFTYNYILESPCSEPAFTVYSSCQNKVNVVTNLGQLQCFGFVPVCLTFLLSNTLYMMYM